MKPIKVKDLPSVPGPDAPQAAIYAAPREDIRFILDCTDLDSPAGSRLQEFQRYLDEVQPTCADAARCAQTWRTLDRPLDPLSEDRLWAELRAFNERFAKARPTYLRPAGSCWPPCGLSARSTVQEILSAKL